MDYVEELSDVLLKKCISCFHKLRKETWPTMGRQENTVISLYLIS